jgi:3'-phosphoadenosine 5'-phosphosulfate sulfotransferase (PAPS reductase)/FAD synthetase
MTPSPVWREIAPTRAVAWFSCGAASAVAARLATRFYADLLPVEIAYCETNAEHPDNERFMADCERWIGAKVQRLSSAEYLDTWHVWEDRRYIAGVSGAPCTGALKRAPREAFQRPGDIHVFGYTSDEADRAELFKKNNPSLICKFPLIEKGLNKEACLAMVQGAGIALPVMYGLGFHNNNCIPCPKATSPNYWAVIREHFPEQFERMAKLSRELGARLARINDERVFIDEIPADWPALNPIAPACDFLCHLAEQDLAA